MRQINPSKVNGPDRLPNWVLKTYADIKGRPLQIFLTALFVVLKFNYKS